MENKKAKIIKEIEDVEYKLSLFIGRNEPKIIKRLSEQLNNLKLELELIDRVSSRVEQQKQEEAIKEAFQVDSTTQKLWSKVESGINHMELLKSNGMEVGNTFTQLKRDYKAMLEREKLAGKVYGDLDERRPQKVTEFMKKFEAIDKKIQADALANKQQNTKLTDKEIDAYESVGIDVAVGLGIQFDGSDEQ